MRIDKQIKAFLSEEYNDGKGLKQTEMAKLHNVSQQYICRLLSGKRECEDITIKTVMKMFPRATLCLTGESTTSDDQVQDAVEAFRHQAIDALIGLDISPDVLLKVLKTLKDLRT